MKSLVSYMPSGRVYPKVVVDLYFRSNISINSSYVSWNLYTISSRSSYFEFLNSSSISFSKIPRLDKESQLSNLSLFCVLFNM